MVPMTWRVSLKQIVGPNPSYPYITGVEFNYVVAVNESRAKVMVV